MPEYGFSLILILKPPEMFNFKGVLKNIVRLTGKYKCHSLSFSKVVGSQLATLLKKGLRDWCFSVKFAKFLLASVLKNTSEGALLTLIWRSLFV